MVEDEDEETIFARLNQEFEELLRGELRRETWAQHPYFLHNLSWPSFAGGAAG